MNTKRIKRVGKVAGIVVYIGLVGAVFWWMWSNPSIERLNMLMELNAALLHILLVLLVVALTVSLR